MASRLPNDSGDEASAAAAAAAAFQSALAQQVRPLLGWDPVTAIATMHRNLLHQQQQHHNPTSITQSPVTATAGLTPPPTSLPALPALWPYGLQAGLQAQPNSAVAATAAASLASLGPATSYLNQIQNLHTPESLMSFQQNLLLLEQLHQKHQLLAANPHLLMAAQLSNNLSSSSPQTQPQQDLNNLLIQQAQQMQRSNGGLTYPFNFSQNSCSTSNSIINTNSLLTTVNSSLAPTSTNQHQDSLVDQHFRRSLGEDYNQIMSSKVDKINVGK